MLELDRGDVAVLRFQLARTRRAGECYGQVRRRRAIYRRLKSGAAAMFEPFRARVSSSSDHSPHVQSVALGRSHRSSDEKDCRRRAKKISSQAGTNRSWAILRESPEGKSGMAWNVNAPAAWKLAAMRRTSSFGQTLGDSRKRLDAPCHRSPKRRCRRRHPSGWRPSCCRCSYLPTQALRA
jgi:hypothetical protein